jgi:signal transduction histidine kinase
LVLISLGVIVYYTAFTYLQVPFYGFIAAWKPDNVLAVDRVPAGREVSAYLQPGDRILAIDGVPVRQRIWGAVFSPGQASYDYTVQRDGRIHHFTIPVEPPTLAMRSEALQNRTATGLVALAFWLVGAAVVLFATPQNREAWLLGLVVLATATILAASEAALYNGPGAWLLSNPLYPLLSVLLVRLAFLSQQGGLSRTVQRVFRVLYGVALALGLVALFELLFLNPRGSSFELISGVSLYGILLLTLALGALANILVLLWRLWRMPPSYARRQILILLVFTTLAIVPGQLLTFYPWLLFDSPILSWALANLMLALIPAGYAYVIFRRRYLQLDIFMTNTLTLLIVVVLLSVTYSVAARFLRDSQFVQSGILAPGLIIAPLLLAVPYASRPVRRTVQVILYGAHQMYRERLADFSAMLTTGPEVDSLRTVFHKAMLTLQVRQAALILADGRGVMLSVELLRVGGIPSISTRDVSLPDGTYPYLSDSHELSQIHREIASLSWIQAVAPLVARGHLVGLLLLGPPVPDGSFNAQSRGFLRQLADMMAVAALNIQLFESSRAMSRKLLQVRDAERLHVASQIHDRPLQRVSWLANELQRLSGQVEGDVAEQLHQRSKDLFEVATELRTTCAGLYPPVRQQGLQWAVRDAVYEFRQSGERMVHLDIDLPGDVVVASDVTTSAYHILLEALNNVYKHAQATTVWIKLYQRDVDLCLVVEDDGRADETVSMSVPDLLRGGRFGLAGMHEWANMVGGKLVLSQREGGGTSVCLTVPSPWQGA